MSLRCDLELRQQNGASEQICFFTTPTTARRATDYQGQKVLPMNHVWNNKARVSIVTERQGSHHTHENLFCVKESKNDPARIKSLM